jgi:multimeric flavodoxin WrbA
MVDMFNNEGPRLAVRDNGAMRVVAINGSPRANGNTQRMLDRMGKSLQKQGIQFEIIHVGNKAIRGCLDCGGCSRRKDSSCSITDDIVNSSIRKMIEADGIVLGSPVYFSGISGQMKSFLDRVFLVASENGGLFRHKVGAAMVAVQRSGGSAALDGLNHYLAYSEMLIATSNYWNIVHGTNPGDLSADLEGMQIVDVLAENFAWLLAMRDEISRTSRPEPKASVKVNTSFIR